eukprot:gene4051-biopygen2908
MNAKGSILFSSGCAAGGKGLRRLLQRLLRRCQADQPSLVTLLLADHGAVVQLVADEFLLLHQQLALQLSALPLLSKQNLAPLQLLGSARLLVVKRLHHSSVLLTSRLLRLQGSKALRHLLFSSFAGTAYTLFGNGFSFVKATSSSSSAAAC